MAASVSRTKATIAVPPPVAAPPTAPSPAAQADEANAANAMIASTLGEVVRSLEAATTQLTRVADALGGVIAPQATARQPTVNIWGDDPFSEANPTANPRPGQALAVPLKGLANPNLRIAIAGAAPPIGLHAPGSDAFLYWNAAEALSRGIALWTDLLPQGTTWSAPNPLPVQLVAPGDVLNAFYARDRGLSFFRGAAGGTQIFTALSSDVVNHELGHAVLDALKPQLFHVALPEAAAFHEAFGDISAMLSALELDSMCEAVLRETGGRLSASSRLSRVAESLGWGIRQTRPHAVDADCLRNAANRFAYRQPQLLPTDAPANLLARAPHSFSRVFTGAFFDALAGMFEAGGSQDAVRLRQVSREAGRLLLAAVHTAPVAPDYYSQVAAAMIQSDQALNGGRNKPVLTRAFSQRDILSVSSVMRLAATGPVPQMAGRPAFGAAGALDLGLLQMSPDEPADMSYRQPAGETPDLPIQPIMVGGVQIDVHLPVAPPRFAVASAGAFAFGDGPEEVPSAEMAGRLFVEELIQSGRIESLSSAPPALRGIVPEAKEEPPPRVTHALVNEDGKSKLVRLRFQCCPACQGGLSCA